MIDPPVSLPWPRLAHALIVVAMLLSQGCRSWPFGRGPQMEKSPIVFQAAPTLDDIVQAVNRNSEPIQQMQAETASISVPGLPSLRANLMLERPRNFRLRAQLLGPELDVGSNAELFWFWAKQNPRPAVYFARHDQFAQSQLRQQLPIDPVWMMEALGIVTLDESMRLEGPFPAGPERLEIRAYMPSPEGEIAKVYYVHAKHGWILEQHHYGPQRQLLAIARGSRHQYFPLEKVSLPLQVQLIVPAAELNMTLQVSNYTLNSSQGDPNQLWAPPQMNGYQWVDLGAGSTNQTEAVQWNPAPTTPYIRESRVPRPNMRGLNHAP
ncbi:MAG: hypothetical protein RIS70_2753 [Planctomycetota bacterium]|jgi:hypothetical protein